MSESEIGIIIRIPDPEVPFFRRLKDVALGLCIEELALVKINREALGLAAFVGGQVFLMAKLRGEFLSSISSVPVVPFDEHGAGFLADEPAFFGDLGKVESFASGKDFVLSHRLRAQ